jgi:hypothetical protein
MEILYKSITVVVSWLQKYNLTWYLVVVVRDTASYIRGWIQMVLAPNDLFSWNNKYNKYNEYNVTDTHSLASSCYALYLLCACWHLEAMRGSSSLTSCCLLILSRLHSPFIWAQLRLLVPALGLWPPLPKMAPPFTGSAHTPLPGSGTVVVVVGPGPARTRFLALFLRENAVPRHIRREWDRHTHRIYGSNVTDPKHRLMGDIATM